MNAYNGLNQNKKLIDFPRLLDFSASIPGIKRIRFTTSHPKEFGPELIAAFEKIDKLVDHVHLPVQSGSDGILRLMKRGYSCEEYELIIKKLRKVRPNISIGSDFIVGFPGETDHDFQCTLELIDKVKFDTSFSFMYSPRPGTPASDLPNQVPVAVKKSRLQTLQNALNRYRNEKSVAMLNTVEEVLVEGSSVKGNGEIFGRTSNNRVVNFSGPSSLIGTMEKVRITKILSTHFVQLA